MKALAASTYGPLDNLRAIEVETPEPGPGEVRVRIEASALNPADFKVILGQLKFLHARNKPLVVGYDFSGTVDAVGSGAGSGGYARGDEVFGFLPYGPFNRRGAFAELVVARVGEIARKPAGVPHHVAAAAATTGITAIQAIRDVGRAAAGGRALITGVSGGVGSIAVGVARRLGLAVTALGSGTGLDAAQRNGAADVLDRTKANVAQLAAGALKDRFDVVFDCTGFYRWREWRGALKTGGAFVTTLPSLALAMDWPASWLSSTRVGFVKVKSRPTDLDLLGDWLKDGLPVPIAATIPVRDVARGLAQLQRAGGRVAVTVAGGF